MKAKSVAKAFAYEEKVLFRHCDPAGIVFFPRYFEMINDCIEHFFAEVLDWPFETLLKNAGVPTAEINTRFVAPSQHGDILSMELSITHLGRTSMSYLLAMSCDSEPRMQADARLVHVDKNGKPAAWPKAVKNKLEALRENRS